MKTILFLLLMSSPAMAQMSWTTTSNGTVCYMQGIEFPGRNGVCRAEDMKYGRPMAMVTVPASGGAIASGSVTNSNSTAKCPDGYSLVNAGKPMCAKDLIEPTW